MVPAWACASETNSSHSSIGWPSKADDPVAGLEAGRGGGRAVADRPSTFQLLSDCAPKPTTTTSSRRKPSRKFMTGPASTTGMRLPNDCGR